MLARTLWPSPRSAAWRWHLLQEEIRFAFCAPLLLCRVPPDALNLVWRFLRGDARAALRAARRAASPNEWHNCHVLLRWKPPSAAWAAALAEYPPPDLPRSGYALHHTSADVWPRLAMWNRGNFLAYHVNAPQDDARWFTAAPGLGNSEKGEDFVRL